MDGSIEEFERHLRRQYPGRSTTKHYISDLRLFSCFVNKPLTEVQCADINKFIEDQLARGLAAKTINRRLASLHHFFEFLADETGQDGQPNPVVWHRQRVKEGKPLPRDVGNSTIERFFASIDNARDRLMFGVMCWAGLRVGEVAGLRVSDLVRSEPSLGMARLRVCGKGQKERIVPLAPELVEQWDEWLAQRPEGLTTALFVTRRKAGITVRGIQDRLDHYCQQAGVHFTCHQLRHTFGRWMAEGKMPVTSLAKLLGHAQVSTTQMYTAGAAVEVRAEFEAALARLEGQGLGSLGSRSDPDPLLAANNQEQEKPSLAEPDREPLDLIQFWGQLPAWLTKWLDAYLGYQQRRWKPSQRHHHARARAEALRQIWNWLIQERGVSGFATLARRDIQRYIDAHQDAGLAASTLNRQMRDLWSFLHFLEDQELTISPSVFRVERLKEKKPLPRYLAEDEYQRLEQHILVATADGSREDHLNRAWFYLLAHTGVRLGELCDLRLNDVDLSGQRLAIREGKGLRDRVLPLSETACRVLRNYLDVRGEAQTDHLLIYRRKRINDHLVQTRLRRYGAAVEVEVSPHRLRHTLATRLVNAGMDIISLQRLLGHDKLDTTMIYSHVHDITVERDFRQAMNRLTIGQAQPPDSAGEATGAWANDLFSHARLTASGFIQALDCV